jgi:hypothetical protein
MERFITAKQVARMTDEPLLLREALAACRGLPGNGFAMHSATGGMRFHVGPDGIRVVANPLDDAYMEPEPDGLNRLRAAMRAHGLRSTARDWEFYVHDAAGGWPQFAAALARARVTRQCACGRGLVHGPGLCCLCVLDNFEPAEQEPVAPEPDDDSPY